jgi:hypothetical protein
LFQEATPTSKSGTSTSRTRNEVCCKLGKEISKEADILLQLHFIITSFSLPLHHIFLANKSDLLLAK